jgi:hypothetical protein
MEGERRQSRQGSHKRRPSRAQQVLNRRFALAVCLLAFAVIATAVGSYSSRAEASTATQSDASTSAPDTTVDPTASLATATYAAELLGDYNSVGSGRALLTLNYDADLGTLSYVLEITSPLGSPSVAAICQGAPGNNAGTVFTLYAGPAIAGNFSGILSQGQVTSADLVGPLQGARLVDLVLLLQRGEAYATIGTVSVPVDAVSGKIH